MFNSARLKLTLWYVLISAIITVSFSFSMFRVLTSELDRVEQLRQIRIDRHIPFQPDRISPEFTDDYRRLIFDPVLVSETKGRILLLLGTTDLIIILLSTLAGYILAGLTLKPIQTMVDSQTRFVSDASHELRTPLTSLKTEIEVNLRDASLSLIQAKKLLASNLEEVDRLEQLSSGLLKLNRYQLENHWVFTPIDIDRLVALVIRKVQPLAAKQKLSLNYENTSLHLEAYQPAIDELLTILLDNAIKYSKRGKYVTVSCEKVGQQVKIAVSDQGIGIPAADLPHVFDRFYRVDKSHSQSVSGYGLGLSIAFEIVKRHQGKITADSSPGKGSTFTVYLPDNDSATNKV